MQNTWNSTVIRGRSRGHGCIISLNGVLEPMRVEYRRTGGFIGAVPQPHIFASEMLADEEARKLKRYVQDARFFQLPGEIRVDDPHPDPKIFRYTITVESEQGRHTVSVDEGAVPKDLQPLIVWLKMAVLQREG